MRVGEHALDGGGVGSGDHDPTGIAGDRILADHEQGGSVVDVHRGETGVHRLGPVTDRRDEARPASSPSTNTPAAPRPLVSIREKLLTDTPSASPKMPSARSPVVVTRPKFITLCPGVDVVSASSSTPDVVMFLKLNRTGGLALDAVDADVVKRGLFRNGEDCDSTLAAAGPLRALGLSAS